MQIQKVSFTGNVKRQTGIARKQPVQAATKPYTNDSGVMSTKKADNDIKLKAASLLMAATALLGASGCSAKQVEDNYNKYQSISSNYSSVQEIDSETGFTKTSYYKDGQLVKKESEGYVNYGKSGNRDIILYEKTIEKYENGLLTEKTKYYGEDKDNLNDKVVDIYENGCLKSSQMYYKQDDGSWSEVLICDL